MGVKFAQGLRALTAHVDRWRKFIIGSYLYPEIKYIVTIIQDLTSVNLKRPKFVFFPVHIDISCFFLESWWCTFTLLALHKLYDGAKHCWPPNSLG
jgi:hypothetical protein